MYKYPSGRLSLVTGRSVASSGGGFWRLSLALFTSAYILRHWVFLCVPAELYLLAFISRPVAFCAVWWLLFLAPSALVAGSLYALVL